LRWWIKSRGGNAKKLIKCDYPDGNYSAKLSCFRCIKYKLPCGSRAIQAAQEKYLEERRVWKREKTNTLPEYQDEQIQEARERLKCDRSCVALTRDLHQCQAHLEAMVTTTEDQRREIQSCLNRREEREQEEKKRVQELLDSLLMINEVYEETFFYRRE
jgi:hypothetical protein